MALKNPLSGTRPMTVGIFMLTALWAVFQWRDPTPPPVLDQILIATYGIWFANSTIDRNERRKVTTKPDGSVTVEQLPDKADDDDATDSKTHKETG